MEKKIAVSKNKWKKWTNRPVNFKLLCIIFAVAAIVFFLALLVSEYAYDKMWEYWKCSENFENYESMTEISRWFGNFALLIGGLSFLLLAFETFARIMAKTELTVTSKRVYGKVAFGRRVDLPVDSVSSVGMSAFHGIAIGTSSGRIVFKGISNRDKLFDAINKLIVDRQQNRVSAADKQPNAASIPLDELKKLKELLDAGIITQEEFDAKKKKLLDL